MPLTKSPWQEALSNLITDPKELLTMLELDPGLLDQAYAAAQLFPLRVPRGYVARMEKGNPHDPLLKQVLPLGVEFNLLPDYTTDPLKEAEVNPIPGLLHKYHGRVLVMLTSACAIHCRYCFRRHFSYDNNNPGRQGWASILTYIAENDTIHEVILSGGDPLVVNDQTLKLFTDQLSLIPHVKRLRIHTRLPVVLPERITTSLIEWITQMQLAPIIVIHANHPREINDEVRTALIKLRAAGILVLNQTVLLKGINDHSKTLIELSETLFTAGVMPYYLHLLDKVQGIAHFDLEWSEAYQLHEKLSQQLPGYLVPKLVREEPHQLSKTMLSTTLYTG